MFPAQFHLLGNTRQDALSNSTQSLEPDLAARIQAKKAGRIGR